MSDGDDTDSEMMRIQQGKDAPVRIAPDENQPVPESTDSDFESAAGRASAIAGAARYPLEQQDQILADNQRADSSREADVFETGEIREKPPLARMGRSLLGR